MTAGFSLDGKDLLGRIKNKIDFPATVSSIKVEMGRIGLPGQPPQEFVEDERLEEGTIFETPPLREKPGKARISPVKFRAFDQPGRYSRQERAQQVSLIGNLQKAKIPLDGVDSDSEVPRQLRVREQLRGSGSQQVLREGNLIQVGDLPEVCEISLKIGSAEIAQPHPTVFRRKSFQGGIATPQKLFLSAPAPGWKKF